MKRTFALFLLAFVPAAQLLADPAAQADPQSLALIAALRVQDVVVQTSSAGLADAQKRGAASAQATECTARFLVANLGTELAMLVPRILTRAEIIASLKFFESETGRKLMAHNLAMLGQQRDGKPNPAYPDPAPTADDTKNAKAFLATEAGRKINESGYLLKSPEVHALITAKSQAAAERCKAPTKPATGATKK